MLAKIEKEALDSKIYIILNIPKDVNQQTVIYAKEFDEFVSQYNEWLVSLGNPKVQRQNRWHAFFRGMGSVLDLFGTSSLSLSEYSHPLYPRGDLTSEQKDAIALASDWQRVDRALDTILSGDSSNGDISVKDATQGRHLVRDMYEHFRNVYVANAIR